MGHREFLFRNYGHIHFTHWSQSHGPHCLCSDAYALLFLLGYFPVSCGPVRAILGSNHIFMARQTSQLLSSFRVREEQPSLRRRDLSGDIYPLVHMDHFPSQLESSLR